MLNDDFTSIENSIYIIGREDMGSSSHLKKPRKDLSSLISGLDKSKPLILLDHQPSNLKEPIGEGIDLQLSGHTHRGQFFPLNFITNAIFENDWGYLKKNDFPVSYTHLRAHETVLDLVCRLLLEKKNITLPNLCPPLFLPT